MPFARTWTDEQLTYLISAYQDDIPLREQSRHLGKTEKAIGDMAARLNLTDAARRNRVKAKLGYLKITDEVLQLIEDYVIDWRYSARKISRVLAAEHDVKVKPEYIRAAIHTRASTKCKRLYSRYWGVSRRKKRRKTNGSHSDPVSGNPP